MSILIIRIWELADLFEKEGQIRITPKNDKLGIEIYENSEAEGNVTVLIPGVIQRPSIGINSPDDFFKELLKEIEHHLPKITKLVFQHGGSMPIPEWFIDWCKSNGIEIGWVDEEIIKNQLTTDAYLTFNDLINEL